MRGFGGLYDLFGKPPRWLDNRKRVTVAIAISEISRLPRELEIVKEMCVRVYGRPVRSGLP